MGTRLPGVSLVGTCWALPIIGNGPSAGPKCFRAWSIHTINADTNLIHTVADNTIEIMVIHECIHRHILVHTSTYTHISPPITVRRGVYVIKGSELKQ